MSGKLLLMVVGLRFNGLTHARAGRWGRLGQNVRVSELTEVAAGLTAELILHGEDDSNVPVGRAMYFHRALAQFGAEHELVVYPRENHVFTERAHQIDVQERVRSWFTRWLGR
jgi:dipeptidyl aminopeptidase/acylaminoacyl peptidase